MNYKETLDWMFSRLPMYQRQGKIAFKKDLKNTLALAEHLNDPHKKIKCIHVAGTNGKGSTSHMLASILQEAGYEVGLYTSPHLKDFRERIKINGEEISEKQVIDFVAINKKFLEAQGLSFFEMTVGLAFYYFAFAEVDIAIIEVGLGGRLDSTNIIFPEVSVITNIGYDHTQFLGDTLSEIAFEKAGIIKNNVPVIIGERQEETEGVFSKVSKNNNAQIVFAENLIKANYKTDLLGDYQKKNVITAVATIKTLNNFTIHEKDIRKGLLNVVKNTGLKGRWQVLQIQPKVICDTAHNKEGLIYVLEQLENENFNGLHVVLGVVNDKNLEKILPMFPKEATYYFCRPNIPRGLDVEILKEKAKGFKLPGMSYSSVNEAYKNALKNATKEDVIYVGGSTFVVAEIL